MNIFFVSLGCDKNLVDSEMMLTSLQQEGFFITQNEEEADAIVVNTCCFIGDAKEESINMLLEMAEYKKTGKCKVLVAAGCLAQRYYSEIREQIPEVDVIIGTMGYEKLPQLLKKSVLDPRQESIEDINYTPLPIIQRDSTSGGYFAYLKIAEGCDKCCTYCIIPKVRGHYRSIPMDNLLAQASHLVQNGARELVLVAQETTLYGTDIYGKNQLPELLKQLSELDELHWIRILYCYPEDITDEFIDAMVVLPKVCHYLDIPVQHASDSILKRMGRHTTQKELEQMIKKLRKKIPDIALRTTMITGFPGETEEDFETTMAFVTRMQFDRLGVFTYSREEDTPAASMPDQIEAEVSEARRDAIMQLQQDIVFAKNDDRIGQVLEVMIIGSLPDEHVFIARTYMDAPQVDGYIFVHVPETWHELMSGDFLQVRITGAKDYDLIGEALEN